MAKKPELSEEEVEEIDPQYEDEYPKPQPQLQREPKGRHGGLRMGNMRGKAGVKRSLQGFRKQFSAYGGSQ